MDYTTPSTPCRRKKGVDEPLFDKNFLSCTILMSRYREEKKMEREEAVIVEVNLRVLRDMLKLSPWERNLLRSVTEQSVAITAAERFARYRRLTRPRH